MSQQQGKAHSCLIERMRHYIPLSSRDEALLRELERDDYSLINHT